MCDFVILKQAAAIGPEHPLFNMEAELRIAALALPDKQAWILRLAIAGESVPDSAKAVATAIIASNNDVLLQETQRAYDVLKQELIDMDARRKSFLEHAMQHF
jgi:hypothetical protein